MSELDPIKAKCGAPNPMVATYLCVYEKGHEGSHSWLEPKTTARPRGGKDMMLTGEEAHLLCDEIGFEPLDLEEFIADALADSRRYTDPAFELETMAKAAKGLLALWRAERESSVTAQPEGAPDDA